VTFLLVATVSDSENTTALSAGEKWTIVVYHRNLAGSEI
jgi:hypothetical protein